MYERDLEADPNNFTKFKVGDKVTYNGKDAVVLDIKPFFNPWSGTYTSDSITIKYKDTNGNWRKKDKRTAQNLK
jgi:hypothetical protein